MDKIETPAVERADKPKRPRRLKWWLWASMLSLVGLVALAFSMYWFSTPTSWPFTWPGQPSSVQEQFQALENRFGARMDNELSAVSEKLDDIAQDLATLERTVANGETASNQMAEQLETMKVAQSRQADELSVLQRKLEDLQGSVLSLRNEVASASRSTGGERDARLSEELGWVQLRGFLHEAQRALALDKPPMAMVAYNNAMAWIEQSQSPVYEELLRILAREKNALESWTPIPWSSFEQAVADIQISAHAWPVRSDQRTSNSAKSAARAEDAGGWLARLAARAKEVVIVRPREPIPTQAVNRGLGPQLLTERLERLQLVLARRDISLVRSQASLVRAQLDNSYDVSDSEVSAALTLLDELSVIEQAALPAVVGSAQAMVEQRLSNQ